MFLFIAKVLFTSFIIVIVSEVALKSDKYGGLIAAIPLTTFLIIFWMYFEGASDKKIANHITFTLFFVLPTLPMFLVFPYIIQRFGFFISVLLSLILTSVLIYFFNYVYEHFGIKIL
ncbi:MAG: hypothetical protein CMQ40_05225 [Gammaproteobacteria bacterium]|nr:hypothetical protein [Gammaproteobacteria bacterium]|tara:strand:+ start:803 stop:1153 length:351 start_codon:yes stop_codon:yes gene_type:complete